MEFQELTFGAPGNIYARRTTGTLPFTLKHPANQVQPLLQGFEIGFNGDDHHLRDVDLRLEPHYVAGDRGGTITVHFTFTDDTSSFSYPPMITGYVKILLVAN